MFDFFGGKYEEAHPKLIEDKPIPKNVQVDLYTDNGCKNTKTNPYGENLTYFYAKDVRRFPKEFSFKISEWNKAIISFLRQLSEDTIIVLEWR